MGIITMSQIHGSFADSRVRVLSPQPRSRSLGIAVVSAGRASMSLALRASTTCSCQPSACAVCCAASGWPASSGMFGFTSSTASSCFVPYLLNNAGRVSWGGFPDAWRASLLSRSLPARRRNFGNRCRSLTGAPLKFPTSERASSIQRASSLRPARLNKVSDSGSRVLTGALPCPFTLVPTTPAKTPQPI
jgi:hypothetical protein